MSLKQEVFGLMTPNEQGQNLLLSGIIANTCYRLADNICENNVLQITLGAVALVATGNMVKSSVGWYKTRNDPIC